MNLSQAGVEIVIGIVVIFLLIFLIKHDQRGDKLNA